MKNTSIITFKSFVSLRKASSAGECWPLLIRWNLDKVRAGSCSAETAKGVWCQGWDLGTATYQDLAWFLDIQNSALSFLPIPPGCGDSVHSGHSYYRVSSMSQAMLSVVPSWFPSLSLQNTADALGRTVQSSPYLHLEQLLPAADTFVQ